MIRYNFSLELFIFPQDRDLDWFPRLRAMSLAADESEGEQVELRSLQMQLATTQKVVTNLTQQLFELREQVRRFARNPRMIL